MKKKIMKIVASSLGVVLVSALLAAGIFMLVRNKNVEETGNVLGVSWYNETEEMFEITTVEQLNEFAELSKFYTFQGQTIKLGADIVVNDGNAADWAKNKPGKRWMPIVQFAGTFDGQGHTISGLYGKGYEAPMALFAKTDSTATVQNLSLVNSYFETGGSGGAASFSVKGDGKFIKLYSDAIINNKGEYSGGIVARVSMNANFEECWYDGTITQNGRWLGGIVGSIDNGRVLMKHCLSSGNISTKQEVINYASTDGVRAGGLCGSVNMNATFMVEDSLAAGEMTVGHNTYAGTIVGAVFNGGTGNMTDVYTTNKIVGVSLVGAGSGRLTAPPAYIHRESMLGVRAYQWSTLDFDNYWAVVEGDTPVLKHFAKEVPSLAGVEKAYDISWYSPSSYDVTINNLKELYGLALLSQTKTFEGVVIRLGADIVVNEGKAETWLNNPKKAPDKSWNPIGSKECRFAGIFDGQGHSISGLYYNGYGEAVQNIGFIGFTQLGSVVKNLKVVNSYYDVSGNTEQRYVGGIVGYSLGSLDTLYSDVIIKADGRDIGGIAGYLNYTGDNGLMAIVVNNCWFNGKLIGDTGRRMGGITGAVFGVADNIPTYTFTNCLYTGYISNKRISHKEDGLGGQCIGGILGQEANPTNVVIKDCLSAGKIDVVFRTYVGSIMGTVTSKGSTVTFDNVYATTEGYDRYLHLSNGTTNGAAIIVPEKIITGVNGYKWTTLDFNTYWAAAKNGTPVLKSFSSFAKVQTTSVAKEKRMVDIAWYNASKKEFTIDTLEELYGFWLLSNCNTFEGQTIKLGADIAVNKTDKTTLEAWKTGTATATNPWFSIGSKEMRFMGTFDGQMHQISGIYLDTTLRNQYLGLFGFTELGSTIKNLKVTGSLYDIDGNTDVRYAGGVVGYNRSNLETLYSDVEILCDGQDIGGIAGYMNFHEATAEQTIQNLWFNGNISGQTGRRMGGITGAVFGAADNIPTYTFTNCLYTGYMTNKRISHKEDGLGGQCIGGILGQEANPTNVVIKDCLSTGEIDVVYRTYVGSIMGTVTSKGSTVTFDNVYATTEGYDRYLHLSNGTTNGAAILVPEKIITGIDGYKWTTLDFNTYWVAAQNGTPVLKSFSSFANVQTVSVADTKRMVDISWYDSSKKQFTIDTLEELYGFWLLSNSTTFEGQTVKLGADIAVNKTDKTTLEAWKRGTATATNPWFSIGSKEMRFMGTFDGQMHQISGIYLDTTHRNQYLGVFGFTEFGSTIKNLIVTDSVYHVSGDTKVENVGGIVGYSRGNLDTLYCAVDIVCDGQTIGGIVGYVNFHEAKQQQTMNNLWFAGSISGQSGRRIGGISGGVYGNEKNTPTYKFENCLNTGTLSNTRTNNDDGLGGQYIGGILAREANQTNVILKDCMNAGLIDVTYTTYVGNLIGKTENATSVYTMNNVYMVTDAYATMYGESKATIDGHVYKFPESALVGEGGYQWTKLDFKKYWTAVADTVPALKSFAKIAGIKEVDISQTTKPIDTKWYDKNPNADKFEIKTREELYGLWNLVANGNSFKGKEIELVADIAINEVKEFADGTTTVDVWKSGSQKGVNPWFAIGSQGAPFAGTFNGNNHTISGICIMESTAGDYQGVFAYTSKESMIQNLKVTDSYFEMKGNKGQQYVGGIVAYAEGSLKELYSDVDIVTDGIKLGGIAGALDYTKEMSGRVLENCWFAGSITGEKARQSGGIVGAVIGNSKMDVTYIMKNCLFTGYLGNDRVPQSGDGCGGQYIGSMLGFDSGKAHITIINCVSAGTLKSQYGTYMGSVVGRVENKNSTLTIDNSYVTSETYSGKTIGEAVNTESVKGDATKVGIRTISGYGALATMNFDFDNEWSAILGSVPIPTSLLDITHQVASIDTEWYYNATKDKNDNEPGTKDNPYKINNANDFYGLAKLINEEGIDFTGKIIVLTDNIYLNQGNVQTAAGISEWTPIKSFAGTLDGQGHVISGMSISSAANRGMFVNVSGTLQNFTLSNSVMVAHDYSGAIAGELSGVLHGICVDETVLVKYHQKVNVGGLVGAITTGKAAKITNCSFAGTISWLRTDSQPTKDGGHGGIVGVVNGGTCELVNCMMSGTVEKGYNVGGLMGYVATAGKATLRNCLVTGTVSGTRTFYHSSVGNVRTVDTIVGVNVGSIYVEDVYAAGTNAGTLSGETFVTLNSNNVIDGIGLNWGGSAYIYGLTETVESADDIKGNKAWTELNLDFYSKHNKDGVWIAIDNGLPKLKIAVTEADTVLEEDYTGTTVRLGWYYMKTKSTNKGSATVDVTPAEGTVFEVETVGDMYGLKQLVNGSPAVTFAGYKVELCNDLVFNPNWDGTSTDANNWDGIGNTAFAGTFDGKNHTISKIYQNRAGIAGGLFRRVSGTLQNLTISDSSFNSEYNYIGGAVGHLSGTMDNVHLDAGVSVYGGSSSYHVGGLTSYINSAATINNCSFAGTVTGGFSTRGTGGLIGTVEETNEGTCTISNSAFTGTVNGTKPAGGILGMIRAVNGKQLDVNVTDCVVSGTVTLTETSSQWGSVCGRLEANTKITLTNVNTSACNRSTRCASPEGTVVDNDK